MPFIGHSVTGFDDLKQILVELDGRLRAASFPGRPTPSHIIFVFFTDSKLPDGLNWCEQCAIAEPMVDAALAQLEEIFAKESANIHWVTCHVGARDYWYNPNNPFRRDRQLRLYQIPALLGTYRKGGEWADESDDVSQIYEKEEDFGSVKAVEEAILNFVDLAARFGRRG